jgi:hypothetical protein
MKTLKVRDHQTWFDLALQISGGIDNVFDLLSPTDSLDTLPAAGRVLEVETVEATNRQHLLYYQRHGIVPATGMDQEGVTINEGIGYWVIEDDFVVS